MMDSAWSAESRVVVGFRAIKEQVVDLGRRRGDLDWVEVE